MTLAEEMKRTHAPCDSDISQALNIACWLSGFHFPYNYMLAYGQTGMLTKAISSKH